MLLAYGPPRSRVGVGIGCGDSWSTAVVAPARPDCYNSTGGVPADPDASLQPAPASQPLRLDPQRPRRQPKPRASDPMHARPHAAASRRLACEASLLPLRDPVGTADGRSGGACSPRSISAT